MDSTPNLPSVMRMRRISLGLSAIFLAALPACGPSTQPAIPPSTTVEMPPSTTIEESEILEGVFITVEAQTVISGKRPTLVFVCGGSPSPSFQLYLKHAPAAPPPLRGVYGTFTVDEGPSRRIELGWNANDGWIPREGEAPQAARLVRQFIAGRRLQLLPPEGYSNGVPIRWNAATFAARLPEIRRRCGL